MSKAKRVRQANRRRQFIAEWDPAQVYTISYPDGCWEEFSGVHRSLAACKDAEHDPRAHDMQAAFA